MIRYVLAAAALAGAVLYGCGGSSAAPLACEDLKGLSLQGATITTAQSVPAGSFTAPATGPIAPSATLTGMPAFCRVSGIATPSSDSSIGFEVWLPLATVWNGKYMQVGTQGYAGGYQWVPMSVALKRG